MGHYSLQQLADIAGGEVVGDGAYVISGLSSVETPQDNSLAYVSAQAFVKSIDVVTNVAYIVKPQWQDDIKLGIIHDNPTQAFRLIANHFVSYQLVPKIEDSAIIAPSAKIADGIYIGHNVVIGDNVIIESGCSIGANTVINAGSMVGCASKIDNSVVIESNSIIGKDCHLSSGVVIGSKGFGYSFEAGHWHHIPQLGRVVIGNRVEIGANTCIDRGAINDTVINDGVIIDNLVHIAHNVEIGEGSALAGCVGVAGSTRIGKYCMFGGQVGVAGHISICDGVQVGGGANILKSITSPGSYAGVLGAQPQRQWSKMSIYFKRIEELFLKGKKEK